MIRREFMENHVCFDQKNAADNLEPERGSVTDLGGIGKTSA
jgi:hypothetical protein